MAAGGGGAGSEAMVGPGAGAGAGTAFLLRFVTLHKGAEVDSIRNCERQGVCVCEVGECKDSTLADAGASP